MAWTSDSLETSTFCYESVTDVGVVGGILDVRGSQRGEH